MDVEDMAIKRFGQQIEFLRQGFFPIADERDSPNYTKMLISESLPERKRSEDETEEDKKDVRPPIRFG